MAAAAVDATSALELAQRLRRREISSVELARATFQTIAEKDPSIHAFVELDERRALRAAERADERLRGGGDLPAFLGVPTAIKDSEHVRFLHMRVGSRALKWVISPFDAKVTRRCREGGFVIVGKTSTSEEMRKRHPKERHWYLWFLGVEPERQGQGLGSTLLASLRAKAEADGAACWLETDKSANVGIYQHHGYVVESEDVLLPETVALRMWFMRRSAVR